MGLDLPTLALAKKYTDLKTSVTDEQINVAVNQYLENNPIAPGASPEESAQIEVNKQNITNLQNKIVMRSPAIITEAIGTGRVNIDDASSNPFVDFKIKGTSEQFSTTGAQLLDLSAINKSVAGAVVNYADGGYSISGTGALTASFTASYSLDIKNALKPGNLILKSELTIPKLYIRIWDGNTVLAEMQGNNTKQITQEMINNENVRVECFLYAAAGNTITPGTYHPMLYQDGDGTWEPYTGGKPSPSPDYPQPIKGTGTVSTGVQLFDASKIPTKSAGGATVTNNGDGSFIVNGSGNLTEEYFCRYKYSKEETLKLVKPGKYSMTFSPVYPLMDFIIQGTGVTKAIRSSTGAAIEITEADLAVEDVYLTIDVYGQRGKTITPGTITPMVWMKETLPTDADWEPYTGGEPSPSPDYPQSLDVKVTGANLLDLGIAAGASSGGATISIGSGGYTISGTGALTTSFEKHYRTDIKRFLRPGNLILKSEITIPRVFIYIRDGNTLLDSMYGNMTKQITQEMLDNENVFIELLLFGSKDTVITPGTYYPMLYQDGDGTYQPYHSSTTTITLTEPLRGIGDHKDMITMTKRIDRCVELVFDGSENWATISTYEGFYYAGILPFSAMRRAGLCNQFPVDTKGDAIESVRIGNGNSVLFCVYSRFYDDAAADKGLSAWKAHLAVHPLKVVTYLDTSVETDLDATTVAALNALTSYKGHTTVSVATGGPEPDITLEYVADTKTYIANEHAKMQAEFDRQIAAILALLPAETQAAMINNETSALLAESEV